MSKQTLFSFIFFFFILISPLSVSAQSVAELQVMIDALLADVAVLQAQLADTQTQTQGAIPSESVFVTEENAFVFSHTLSRGTQDDEVTELQKYLATFPDIYPEGLVTGYFGFLTQKAVQRFQVKHSIVSSGTPSTTGYGLVGPQTRKKLNEHHTLSVEVKESTTITPEVDIDVVAPMISNIQETNFAEDSITITWDTDEAVKSYVEYSGVESMENSSVAQTTNLVVSHRVNITELSQGTTYYYVVSATDTVGNITKSDVRFFSTTASVAEEVAVSDIIGHWSFDEISGDVVGDVSGNSSDGVLMNTNPTIAWVSGKIGGALKFDSINDYVSIPHTSTLNVGAEGKSYSVSFWFNRSGVPKTERFLLGKSGNAGPSPFEFRFDQESYVTFRISDGAKAPRIRPPKIVSGAGWVHLVGVRDVDTDKIYLYINGEEGNGADKGLSVFDTTVGSIQNEHPVRINRTKGVGNVYYYDPFTIDDVRIYSRALSAIEIKDLYNELK